MSERSTAASPPAAGADGSDGYSRRGVLAVAGSVLATGCAGLDGDRNRNEPEGGPGFVDGEERVLHPTRIALDGAKGLMTNRDVHLSNNHERTHELSVAIARDGEELFSGSYALDEQDEVELDDLFVTHGSFTVTVGMDGEHERPLDVVIDEEHLGVRGTVFADGTLSVRQVRCDSNSCP